MHGDLPDFQLSRLIANVYQLLWSRILPTEPGRFCELRHISGPQEPIRRFEPGRFTVRIPYPGNTGARQAGAGTHPMHAPGRLPGGMGRLNRDASIDFELKGRPHRSSANSSEHFARARRRADDFGGLPGKYRKSTNSHADDELFTWSAPCLGLKLSLILHS